MVRSVVAVPWRAALSVIALCVMAASADLFVTTPAHATYKCNGNILPANTALPHYWYRIEPQSNSAPGTTSSGTIPEIMESPLSNTQVTMYYCTMQLPTLPTGSYCFLQNRQNSANDWCPTGFSTGSRKQPTEDDLSHWKSGPQCTSSACSNGLPRYTQWVFSGTNNPAGVTWHFCCRDNAAERATNLNFDGIRKYLPKGFVLYRKGGTCQPILGRTVSTGYLHYDDEDSGGGANSGSIPDGEFTNGGWLASSVSRYQFCTYSATSVPYEPSSVIVTDRTATSITVQWTPPNYTGEVSPTYYNVRVRTRGGSWYIPTDGTDRSSTATTITISGLSVSTGYDVIVYSGNNNKLYETIGKMLQTETCTTGMKGAGCDVPICSPTCSSKGTCTAPNVCTCQTGWAGSTCTTCAANYYSQGGQCLLCPACVKGYCSSAGSCTCNTGWAGTLCELCADGYYYNNATSNCAQCHSSCATCTGPSANQCASCPANSVLTADKECSSSCPSGQFLGTSKNCLTCQAPCATCTNLTSCLTCALSSDVLQGSSCVQSCNAAHYVDANRVCRACDSRCTECSGPLDSNCTVCAPGYVLSGSTCILASACTAGNGYISGSHCLPCHASCAGCTGGAASQCIGCATAGHVKQFGACQAKCDSGYALIGIECTQCPSPCATCTSISTSSCTSCLNELALNGGTCVETCPSNMFRNGSSVCVACHESCATCSGAGASACVSCANVNEVVDNGVCVDECPDGRYADSSKTCQQCNATCATCAGSADYCLTCTSSSHVAHEGACLDECPVKYYNVSGVCEPCDESCERCSGPTSNECTACAAPTTLLASVCVAESVCADQPGYVDASRVCQPCNATCVTCSSATICTSCLPYQFLSNGACLNECDDGTYKHIATSTCRPCESPCATCGSGPNECTSCEAGMVLEGTVCREACYVGEVASLPVDPDLPHPDQPKCGACDAECAACDGPSASDCTWWAEGGSTVPTGSVPDCEFYGDDDYCLRCGGGKVAHGGVCVLACPGGTVSDGALCRDCDATCAECNDSTCEECSPAYSSCTACQEGLLLTPDGRCLTASQCAAENAVGFEGACLPCDASCDGCSLPAPELACTACVNSSLVLLEGECTLSCRADMYIDEARVCRQCSSQCTQCESATECVQCLPGSYLYQGACVSTCSAPGTVASDETGSCEPCFDTGCLVCSSTAQGACLQCEPSLARHEGGCVSECTGGTFNTTINGESVCTDCAPNCAECTGYFACSRCSSDEYAVQPIGVCYQGCPYGMYVENGVCTPCHGKCETCSGGTEADCLTCPFPNVLHEVLRCLNVTQCLELPGHYVDESGPVDTCEQCDPSCASCTMTSTHCTSCHPGNVMVGTSCVPMCPAGKVANAEGVCEDCYVDCETCSSRLAEGCTSCKGSLVLRPDGRCADVCPAGSFEIAGTRVCGLCHESCSSCTGPNAENCLSCVNSTLVLNEGRCTDRCPPDQVRQGAQCVPCQSPCMACTSTPTYCTLCQEGKVATGTGACVDRCPDGQYPEGGVCTSCPRTCRTCNGGTEYNCTACFDDVRVLANDGRCACLPGTGEYSAGTEGHLLGRCIVCPDGQLFDPVLDSCTSSSAGGATGDNRVAMIVGIVVGVLFLLLLALLVIVLVLRRRTQRRNKEIEELMDARGNLYMVSNTESGRRLTMRSRSIMESSEVEATLLNTQLELALPGFLLLNFDTDLRLGNELSVGGTAVLYQADLVSPALQREHGTERVAVKHLTPGKDADMVAHLMRFRQEVAIMWTLSFHPNIIKLIGYTEDPTCIVTHLYDTDLGRYLYNVDNPFTPQMAFSVACKIASALAAIHKHNCIHRDMKTANILVNVLPDNNLDVFICDFGLARNLSAVTVVSTFVVNGLSARYAAPQVFEAMATGRTLDADTDRACDVYALGIIFWELLSRNTPWEGLQLAEIQEAVMEGHRPSFDIVADSKETLHVLIREVAEACWRQEASERPTMDVVVRRLTVDV